MIVDLREVTFIDSRIVHQFLLALTYAEERSHAGVAMRPDPRVWRTFEHGRAERPVDEQRGRRERRVLAELAGGRTTDAAASAIGLSPHTVRSHLKGAARKLGAETRAHAVALAITQGAIAVGAPPTGRLEPSAGPAEE